MHNLWYRGEYFDNGDPTRAIQRLLDYKGPIAVDTETIALKGDKSVLIEDWDEEGNLTPQKVFMDARTMIGIGCAIGPNEGYYFPVQQENWPNVPYCDLLWVMKEKLLDPGCTKVFFNSMFDLDVIEQAWGIEVERFADVAVACQVQGLWNSLEANSNQLLREDHMIISDVLPKNKTMLDVPFETTRHKCLEDCLTTLKLHNIMHLDTWDKEGDFTWTDQPGRKFPVTKQIKDCYAVDMASIKILRRMTKKGFAIKEDVVQGWNSRLKTEIDSLDNFFKPLGINPMSNDQVGDLMASRGHWMPMTDSRKHLKVDEDVLLRMKDPVAHMVLARRRRQKLYGTYVKPFLDKARAYSHFRLDLATGRLGSWGFNSQNVPPSMRNIFQADCGTWKWMDLHQAEMRVWANQAKDEVMLQEFAAGSSPHNATLKALFPGVAKTNPDGSSTWQYVASKSYNFALLADASDDVLARTTKQPVEMVRDYKAKLYALYWKSREHQNYMRQRHIDYYYPDYVEDDYGRRCHIPDNVGVLDSHQQKCRLNYPFQASVAGVVKRQMIALDAMGYDIRVQVHDELVQDGTEEFPSWLADLHPSVPMPFEVSTAETWV